MPATAHDAPVVHLARPHRPVLVAGTLRELAGPERGLVELPLRLWWNPHRTFDLDQATMLLWMYENVLREAIHVDELRAYLHGPTLIRVWPELNLPRGVRAAWEARHPRLRHASTLPTTAADASARAAAASDKAFATDASASAARAHAAAREAAAAR
jgi:hypothetical protein